MGGLDLVFCCLDLCVVFDLCCWRLRVWGCCLLVAVVLRVLFGFVIMCVYCCYLLYGCWGVSFDLLVVVWLIVLVACFIVFGVVCYVCFG